VFVGSSVSTYLDLQHAEGLTDQRCAITLLGVFCTTLPYQDLTHPIREVQLPIIRRPIVHQVGYFTVLLKALAPQPSKFPFQLPTA
jgi:uncharacterized protein (DUF924 family)